MTLSVFDLFKIGIGPSSSHTLGPMNAARHFAEGLAQGGALDCTAGLTVELFGSLAATAKGHATDKAVVLGLLGERPELLDPDQVDPLVASVRRDGRLPILGWRAVPYVEAENLRLELRPLPFHPNAVRFTARDAGGAVVGQRTFYSVGGGFVVEEGESVGSRRGDGKEVPHRFHSAAELLALCREHGLSISGIVRANELAMRRATDLESGLQRLWETMQTCVRRGCRADGVLPGGLEVRRRAPALYRQLAENPESGLADPLTALDWVGLYALAVNEENAAGGRVVTAPTNGAAGIVPAVLHYYRRFVHGASDEGVRRMLLTATAIGTLFKENASISGAEVGCQGEVGSACSMAAGALCELLGGTPAQVAVAAEIAMEHNLGLTCDPVGGLVQVPCIERNAVAAVKAIQAARLALRGDGESFVSLDDVIHTLAATGRDMQSKYKETARGGLALRLRPIEPGAGLPEPEVSVGLPDC